MLEECAICNQECTPCKMINGHVCQSYCFPERWISVKDQFPELYERVLALSKDNTFHIAYINKHKDWLNEDFNYIFNITHWMPLPEIS